MRSSDKRAKLLAEFPELNQLDVALEKEIYAHFGLAFMKFGLVEHSLINVIVFWNLGEAVRTQTIRNRADWESVFDDGYKRAASQTFGNLTKAVVAVEEFRDLATDFAQVKRLRDYFAHRFMREEAAFFGTVDGCWLLLEKIGEVRDRVIDLENALKPRFEAMCARLKLPRAGDQQLQEMLAGYYNEAASALASGSAKVGWERDAL